MSDEEQQRQTIAALLAGGLKTEVFPRADTPEQREAVVHTLQTSDGSLQSALVIAGFALQPVAHGGFEQECGSCMYFKVHAKHCELPELDLPVETAWSCRLWRI